MRLQSMKGLIPCKKLSMLFEYPQSALFSFELFRDIPTTPRRLSIGCPDNLYVHSKEKLRKSPDKKPFFISPASERERLSQFERNKEKKRRREGEAGHPSRFRTFRQGEGRTFFSSPRDLISLHTPLDGYTYYFPPFLPKSSISLIIRCIPD